MTAGLVTNDDVVLTYLANFYRIGHLGPAPRDWIVEAMVGAPSPCMAVNEWGVAHCSDANERRARLNCPDPVRLAVSARKAIREVLVDYCEQRRYTMLHASAVADDDTVIIIVGDKGSGKTTLAMKAVLSQGMRYLSNDHLIVYPAEDGPAPVTQLRLTSLPSPIPVKIGTYLDLEPQLPAPWDSGDVRVDAYRSVAREQLYRLDHRIYYTFPRLGQQNPIVVDLHDRGCGPAVIVVLAGYRSGAAGPVAVEEPIAALMPHVRRDWPFDPNLNQHYLPRRERGLFDYEHDARNLVTALADRATVIGWHHSGDPADLIQYCRTKASKP
ncbi:MULTISPECIES: hypothetical protein [Nocardia]|uniref:hypothetical protein n=1 Tax=Nocardia TaxID=1817 RepID=UPI0005C20838|nr:MULTISPECIES: hypothetical protein [Nocardia]